MKGVLFLGVALLVVTSAEDASKRTIALPFNLLSAGLKSAYQTADNVVGAFIAGPIIPMWVSIPKNFKFIAAGQAGVWGSDEKGNTHHLLGSYGQVTPVNLASWKAISGVLNYMSVGKNVLVGSHTNGKGYTRYGIKEGLGEGTSWKGQSGSGLKSLCLPDTSSLEWTVNTAKGLYYKARVSRIDYDGSRAWVSDTTNRFTFAACGECAIWALDLSSKVIFRTYSNIGDPKAWISLGDETFKHLAAGDKWVVGVTKDGKLRYRAGISKNLPQGAAWEEIVFSGGAVSMADIYKNQLYITTDKMESWTASLL